MSLLSIPFIVLSIHHVFGEVVNSKTIRHFSKPLLLPALGVFYMLSAESVSPVLTAALAGGWLGDLFLMIPDKGEKKTWFKLGLAAFLIGHIFYAAAFFQKGQVAGLPLFSWVLALVFVLFGAVVFVKMKPFMGALFAPITVYIVVIAIMGVSTTLCFTTQPGAAVWTAVLGAFIFMISDTMNAWNRFAKTIPYERVLTMSTYLAGQFLLVLGYLQFG